VSIYALHSNAVVAATMLCDQHLEPVLLETASVVCRIELSIRQRTLVSNMENALGGWSRKPRRTVARVTGGLPHNQSWLPSTCTLVSEQHPWVLWGLQSATTWAWLVQFGRMLGVEHLAYAKTPHPAGDAIVRAGHSGYVPRHDPQPFGTSLICDTAELCQGTLPVQYRASDAVQAFRSYYLAEVREARWEEPRAIPDWWV